MQFIKNSVIQIFNIDYIKFCFNKSDIKGNKFAYSVDEIYNVVYE